MKIHFVGPVFCALLFGCFSCLDQEVSGYTWTTKEGWKLEAECDDFQDGILTLRKENGEIVRIHEKELSEENREFVRLNTEALKKQEILFRWHLTGLNVTQPVVLKNGGSKGIGGGDHGFGVLQMAPYDNRASTQLSLALEMDPVISISLDDKNSKVIRFADDLGTNLLEGGDTTRSAIQTRFNGTEGPLTFLDIKGCKQPAKGAKKILLEAELSVRCGMHSCTTEHKDLSMDSKREIEIGGQDVRISVESDGKHGGGMEVLVDSLLDEAFETLTESMVAELEKKLSKENMSDETELLDFAMRLRKSQEENMTTGERTVVVLTSDKPIKGLRAINFYDAQGCEIGSSSSSFRTIGEFQTQNRYYLKESISGPITVRIEEYRRIETVVIPVSLVTELDLQNTASRP